PLKFTTELWIKPVPFTVSVKAVPPAATVEGFKEAIVGAGLLIMNDCALEVPPPGVGLVTVTLRGPPATISAAGIVARIFVSVIDVGVIAGLAPKFTLPPL